MTRYRATIAYDGTGFLGFQRQASGRTVQGELENALERLGWSGRVVWGAGRTDTGVHAAGQVIAFDAEWRHGPEDLLRALNTHLPPDVVALGLDEAPEDFSPRRWAKSRRYRYAAYNSPHRHPLLDRYAWQVWPPMSIEALNAASERLLGQHDFAAFGTAPEPGGHTRRRVMRSEWTAEPSEWSPGGLLHFHIEADAFLYRMVRSLVGTLAPVGQGGLRPDAFSATLESRDRNRSGPAAPARGLCLMEVTY